MAHAEIPSFHNPWEHMGKQVREVTSRISSNWKSLTLVVTALGGAGYLAITLDKAQQNSSVIPATPIIEPNIPQIGGRVSGDINELSNYHLVIDQCSSFPGSCIGHLEKNDTEQRSNL